MTLFDVVTNSRAVGVRFPAYIPFQIRLAVDLQLDVHSKFTSSVNTIMEFTPDTFYAPDPLS